ncbi:hypothetical protein B0H67DRAFT_11318 [Lasiosphaeris hirsuta]|uniref:Uncharacterized protein n=1 Tax=Lasiosphaeris hirsuta TaxID=260670 RepID=A0AA40B981_9PEZI|nr:hypothetical protein B0H67DRAFT_11318 [Lasiosphaeris hirsuta]
MAPKRNYQNEVYRTGSTGTDCLLITASLMSHSERETKICPPTVFSPQLPRQALGETATLTGPVRIVIDTKYSSLQRKI